MAKDAEEAMLNSGDPVAREYGFIMIGLSRLPAMAADNPHTAAASYADLLKRRSTLLHSPEFKKHPDHTKWDHAMAERIVTAESGDVAESMRLTVAALRGERTEERPSAAPAAAPRETDIADRLKGAAILDGLANPDLQQDAKNIVARLGAACATGDFQKAVAEMRAFLKAPALKREKATGAISQWFNDLIAAVTAPAAAAGRVEADMPVTAPVLPFSDARDAISRAGLDDALAQEALAIVNDMESAVNGGNASFAGILKRRSELLRDPAFKRQRGSEVVSATLNGLTCQSSDGDSGKSLELTRRAHSAPPAAMKPPAFHA